MTTPTPTTVSFAVEDMTCGNCVRHIDEALKALPPVVSQAIDLPGKRVTVTFDPQATSAAAIAEALEDAGYTPRLV